MNRIILIIIIIVSAVSCRKDEYATSTYNATPYDLILPGIIEQYLPPMDIPTDNPLTEEGVELGRKLFYDTKLSADNTQACASCHSPENSFTDSDQFSTGIDGLLGGRNSMAIINIGWMPTLFWDGRASSVEGQAFGPVINPVEMHNTWPNAVITLQNDPFYPALFNAAFGTEIIDSTLVSKAIAQFERTLISGNSPFD